MREKEKKKKRQRQDSNLRLQRRSDFESHALDHSATLSLEREGAKVYKRQQSVLRGAHVEEFDGSLIEESEKKMQGVGFEPTPPKRIVPETTALDHSAILASV